LEYRSFSNKEYLTMAIFLPGAAEDQALALDEMTPREIVAELDKYVVGQARRCHCAA
jgi:hypothetical protein